MALQVDYSEFALFYRFKAAPWAESITIHWEIDAANSNARPHHPTDAEWWVPDVDNIKVKTSCAQHSTCAHSKTEQ